MVSAIDPTVPVFGSPTTASVRNNFLIAHNEITALQAAVGIVFPLAISSGGTGGATVTAAQTNLGITPITGGTMTGPLLLNANPTNNLGAATKQYVDAYFPVSIANGGTGANNPTAALINLGAAPLASPALTGIPQAPTAPTSDSSTIIATTNFVHNAIAAVTVPTLPVSVNQGGTGQTTLTATRVLLGNGTNPVTQSGIASDNGTTFTIAAGAIIATSAAAPLVPAPNAGSLVLNQNTVASPANSSIPNPNLWLLGPTGSGASINMDCYSTGSSNYIVPRRARGTPTVPTAIQNGDALFQIAALGYDGGAYSTFGNTAINISATENWTTGAHGSAITLVTVPAGTASQVSSLLLYGTQARFAGGGVFGVNNAPGTPNPPTGSLILNANTTFPTANVPAQLAIISDAAFDQNSIWCDGYAGNTAGGLSLVFRRARGTISAPAGMQSGDVIYGLNAVGCGPSGYTGVCAAMNVSATETWTATGNGAEISFLTIPAGSTALTTSLTLNGAGISFGSGYCTLVNAILLSASASGQPASSASINAGHGGIAYTDIQIDGTHHAIGFAWNGALWSYVDNIQSGQIQFVSSDVNLKTNLEPITVDPLGVINQIALQQFDWKPVEYAETTYQKPHWSCGYTAQDIQKLIPEAVIDSGEGPLGVDLMPMVAYLVGSVQELTKRLAALEGSRATSPAPARSGTELITPTPAPARTTTGTRPRR